MVAAKRGTRGYSERSALDLIEEAVHLLRRSPSGVLTGYYLGSLPFVLALLFFWADMTRSAFAFRHIAPASLGLAVLYVWMKFWHAVFAVSLRGRLSRMPATTWTVRRVSRVFLLQAIVQPWSLFILPLAMFFMVPFGWCYAFFHNASLLMTDEPGRLRDLVARTWRQSLLWPKQNHYLVFILSTFGFFVFLNVFSVGAYLPYVIRAALGAENVVSLSSWYAFNTTFLAAAVGVTFLCVNPLVKTVYVLRCFYGESRRNGEDLDSELRVIRTGAGAALLLAVVLTALPCRAGESGEDPPATRDATEVTAEVQLLDHTIDKVLAQPEYSWRMPREQVEPGEVGWLGGFLKAAVDLIAGWMWSVSEWIADSMAAIRDAVRDIFEWLFPRRRSRDGDLPDIQFGWTHALVFGLVAAVVIALVFLVRYLFRRHRRRRAEVEVTVVPPPPDLADEGTSPDELPSDEWLSLATELMERGELRLALRAVYLATLAFLAHCNLIAIARFKSCRDYERELARRAHSKPGMLTVFSENLAVFEGAWYGRHPVSRPALQDFTDNYRRIRTDAQE